MKACDTKNNVNQQHDRRLTARMPLNDNNNNNNNIRGQFVPCTGLGTTPGMARCVGLHTFGAEVEGLSNPLSMVLAGVLPCKVFAIGQVALPWFRTSSLHRSPLQLFTAPPPPAIIPPLLYSP